MITLITAVPGGGKSLRLVDEICKASKVRPVFAHGIDGLKYDEVGAKPFEPARWHEPGYLPDGALLVVDEAWKPDCFPQRMAGIRVPDHVVALRESRHRQMDFIVATQDPKQLDVEVRRLAGRHLHLERLFGTQSAQVFEWAKACDRPKDDRGARSGAVKGKWLYPKDRFGLYESAVAHGGETDRIRLPWKLLAIPVGAVVLAVLFWMFWGSMKGLTDKPSTGVAQAIPADHSAGKNGGGRDLKVSATLPQPGNGQPVHLSLEDYVAAQIPRVASQPWSAPIFDGRPVVSAPDLYCMSVESGPCICHTEQGTKYDLPQRECRIVARHGQYNPWRSPGSTGVRMSAVGGAQDAPGHDLASNVKSDRPVRYESLPAPVLRPMAQPLNAGSAWPLR